jgi:excisionase family DNA binding protein
MEKISFDALPTAVNHLVSEVADIKRILIESNKPAVTDCWFNIEELCLYLPDKPSKATVYGWVNRGLIPVHKGGKRLRFLKSEIDSWLLRGRKPTVFEIERENKLDRDTFLSKINRGNLC